MTLTPRKDFCASPLAKGWADLCASPQFEAAAKAALLELQADLTAPQIDANTSAANNFRLHGARLFLDKMMSLTDAAPPAHPTVTGLDYRH